jgi:dienelactone hydrolase
VLPEAVNARVVRVKAPDGVVLAGTAYGKGPVGVVLLHEIRSSRAAWSSYAPELAARGVLVLAIDERGYGDSPDPALKKDPSKSQYGLDGVAAVNWLRANGARRVVLVGASAGGTLALTTAERRDARADAVVSLSAPAKDGGQLDALAGVARLPRQVLLVAAEFDSSFTEDAATLAKAIPQARHVVVGGSGDHGTDLLDDPAPGGGTIGDLVTAFVLAVRA